METNEGNIDLDLGRAIDQSRCYTTGQTDGVGTTYALQQVDRQTKLLIELSHHATKKTTITIFWVAILKRSSERFRLFVGDPQGRQIRRG